MKRVLWVVNEGIEDSAHVLCCAEILEERTKIGEFSVVRVVEPRRDWDGVVRVEYVGRGRVVEDDGVADRST